METYKLSLFILMGMILFGHQLAAQQSQNMTLLGNFGKGEKCFAAGSWYIRTEINYDCIFYKPQSPVKLVGNTIGYY
jgi:hypothetical protein